MFRVGDKVKIKYFGKSVPEKLYNRCIGVIKLLPGAANICYKVMCYNSPLLYYFEEELEIVEEASKVTNRQLLFNFMRE